jgi:hypothetical protein
MNDKIQVDDWVRSVAWRHVPKGTVRLSWGRYLGQKNVSALGLEFDPKPVSGKVVEINDDLVLFKTARTEFFVASKVLLDVVPALGDTCSVEPYARRRWDGARLDAPVHSDAGGYTVVTHILGETRTRLPIDASKLACPELRDMIDVLERERVDGQRTVVQMLLDAGASSAPIFVQDPSPQDIVDRPPMLRFRVDTAKHRGYIAVRYIRVGDYFEVAVLDNELLDLSSATCFVVVKGLSDIGGVLLEAIDDGSWRMAKVTVLKRAPRPRVGRVRESALAVE